MTTVSMSATINLIENQADLIAHEVSDAYFARHPECGVRGNIDAIRRICKTDLQHHLRFICCALSVNSADMFVDYVHWLKEVLTSRHLSTEHPRDSFELLKIALEKRIASEDFPPVAQLLDAGLAALDTDNNLHQPQESNQTHQPAELATTLDYVNALILGDSKQAEKIALNDSNASREIIDIGVNLVQPAMYKVGELWQANKISVAQEHMATAISTNVLAKAYTQSDFDDPIDKSALFACVEGNHHSLGLRMVSDAFDVKGWDTLFLGADTPTSSIIEMIDKEQPDLVGLSLSLPYQLTALQRLIELINVDFAGKRPRIVVGGLALNTHAYLASRLAIDGYFTDAKSAAENT